MNSLEYTLGELAEEAAIHASRRDFLKLILATGGALILYHLGLEKAAAVEPAGICSQYCYVPCDNRECCLQRAEHYCYQEDCIGGLPEDKCDCPYNKCPNEKMCKHSCKRYCYPNQCRCDPWTLTYSCVWCDSPHQDGCKATCLNCPTSQQ